MPWYGCREHKGTLEWAVHAGPSLTLFDRPPCDQDGSVQAQHDCVNHKQEKRFGRAARPDTDTAVDEAAVVIHVQIAAVAPRAVMDKDGAELLAEGCHLDALALVTLLALSILEAVLGNSCHSHLLPRFDPRPQSKRRHRYI